MSERDLYQPATLVDRTFVAGERRILWRIQVLQHPTGFVSARLSRIGRRIASITFGWDELPDLVKHLDDAKKVNLKGKEETE